LQKVVGTDVGGWQQNDDNDSRTVRVFLRRAVSESTSLTVQLFTQPKITDTVSPITIPDIRPTEVTREVVQDGIFSDPALVIRSGSVIGAAQIEPGEFGVPADFNLKDRKANLAYRYRVRPYAVSISVVRPSARLKAIAEHAVSIERRRIRYTTRFNLQSQGAPRGRFAVLLPDGFLPLEVFATNLTDWYPYKDESGADLLIVDLASPTLKPVELVVTGTLSRDPNELLATVPVPRMNDADTAASQIAIRIDKSYTSSISDSGSWHPISPNAVSTEVQNLAPSEIRFAFRSDELSPDPITIQLDQMSATLFGETVSVISLTDTSVEYSLNFKWIVRQSATDRLAFSGPDWLAGKLEVRCNGLRQVIESEPVDGRITWTLVLQEPVSSEHFALAVATFPPVTAGNLRTPLLRFEPGSNATNPIQVQTHYAVVLNQSERLITPVDPSLRGVQPDELQIKIPARYLDRATQILAVPGNAPPEWTVSTPERRTGAAATVNLADLRTVIAADGSYRTKAVYTIRNRSRQFLPLVLQDGMTVLSVFVKGTPARPVVTTRNEQQVHLIALPRTSEADLSFAVDIVVSGRIADQSVAKGLNIAGSEIQLAVPEVVSTSDDAEFGIPVAMTVWKVHVPKSWHARMIQTASNVTLQDEESSDVIRVMTSLKEAVDQSLSFSSKGDYRRGSYLNKQAAAYDNLKQVEQKIAADQSRVQNDEVASELRELRSNINQLQRQLADQGVQFNADASKAQLQQSQQTYDVSEDFVTNFNKDIAAGNGVSVAPQEQVQPKFRFRIQNAAPFSSGAVPNTKSRGVQQQPATQRALQSSTRNRSSKKSFQNFNKQNYRVQVPEPSPSISFNGNTMSGEAVEPNAPTPDMFGDSPFAEPSSSMNVQGDIVLQPLDDLGAVVIKGNQANIDTVQGILEELGGAVAEKTWTQTGGLSLPIDLASDTVPLNFSKVGGTPELTLRVRPAGTMRKGYGLIWAAVWLGIAVAALFAYRRAGTDGLWSFVPTAVAFVGLVGFVLLTGSNANFAFAVFAVGVLLIGIRAAKRSDDQQHAST
ncbi:MAG: hypothetical protein AB8G99_14190, partial [Planctomycetaceae bacterium]